MFTYHPVGDERYFLCLGRSAYPSSDSVTSAFARTIIWRNSPGGYAGSTKSLSETLDALETDHDYLLKGNVYTKDVVERWIDYKRKKEVDPVRLRPTPYEFYLYYDI